MRREVLNRIIYGFPSNICQFTSSICNRFHLLGIFIRDKQGAKLHNQCFIITASLISISNFDRPAAKILHGTWSFVLVFVVEVKRDYRVFLTKGPPPTKTRQTGKNKLRIALPPKLLDKIQYRIQRFFRTTIVRTDTDIATKLEHCRFFARIQTRFFQNHHTLGFAEDVVVESALRDPVFRRCLGKTHLLSHNSLDCFLEIMPCPRRCLQLQQRRILS